MIYIVGTFKPAIIKKALWLRKNFKNEKFKIVSYRNDFNFDKLIADKDSVNVVISDTAHFHEILAKIRSVGKKIRLFSPYVYGDDKELIEVEHWKPELEYYEYHVSWHCNLNCKGCSHYSNLVKEPRFGNLETYKKDIARLHELVGNVTSIRLMGGEPFLNDKLEDFIIATRKMFPISDLRLVSNGLLIPNLDGHIFEVIRDNNVCLDISQYPPTSKLLDKILEKIKPYNVRYCIGDYVDTFHANSNGSRQNDKSVEWKMCDSNTCHFLSEGCIAVCPAPIVTREMSDVIDFKGEIHQNDIVDLYDTNLTGEKLVKLMGAPIEFCKYCNKESNTRFKWQGGYREYYNED